MTFAIAIRGGGPYSVDRLIGKRTVEPFRQKLRRKLTAHALSAAAQR